MPDWKDNEDAGDLAAFREQDSREQEEEDWEDSEIAFANPEGRSALRAATKDNPRNLPCPTCHEPNRLTPADVALGYQCDECADKAEGGYQE